MNPPWNEEVFQSLTQQSGRRTHSWLFRGAEGLGKLDLAVRYARTMLDNAGAFDTAAHPDFHVLMPENQADAEGGLLQRYGMRYYLTREGRKAKAVISVDQVRALSNALMTYAYGTRKIVLIAPAHQMNINAANALLKVLEEPPSSTIFVLVTNRPDLLAPTVRSRCSAIDFRVPATEQALHWLSGRTKRPDQLELMLKLAGGAPLLALSLDQAGFMEVRNRVIGDIQEVVSKGADVVPIAGKWKELGTATALRILQGLLADVVRVALHGSPPHLSNPDQLVWLQHAVKGIHLIKVFSLMDRIGIHLQDVNTPLDQNLVAEDFLLKLSKVGRDNG